MACATYVGTLADAFEVPIELSVDGHTLYTVHQAGAGGEYVVSHTWPGLAHVADFADTGEALILGIAADPSGNLAIGCGTSGTTRVVDGSGATLFTPPGGYGASIYRRCDDPAHAVILSTRNISGTRHIHLYDIDIASGATTTLLADQALDGVGVNGAVGPPITTPDGAVWFCFYVNSLTPGRIYRWHVSTGLQRVAGVGNPNPGPYNNGFMGLIPRPDSSVWSHFFSSGGSEVGEQISSALAVSAQPCADAFTGGPSVPISDPTLVRIAYAACTPDCGIVAISPFDDFNYYWQQLGEQLRRVRIRQRDDEPPRFGTSALTSTSRQATIRKGPGNTYY